MAKSVSEQMAAILEDVSDAATEAIEECSKSAATAAAKELRTTSPKKTRGKLKGAYAKGWTIKKDGRGYVTYNKAYPGLTHLLEHGHVSKNQYGQYGRVAPVVHIKPVEEKQVDAYIDDTVNTFNNKI